MDSKKKLSDKEMANFVKYEKDERNAAEIYRRLGRMSKGSNGKVFSDMSQEEMGHYEFIANYTGRRFTYNRTKVLTICFLARIFGLMFTLKLLEKNEKLTADAYSGDEALVAFAKTEDRHENALLDMIDEKFLQYMGSIVLGLNDALVEFTGALAGYTLALGNCNMVALTGSITGIAAALSMGSSEYLSRTSEGGDRRQAFRAAIYTSTAYLVTVFLLILPFILISQPVVACAVMLLLAITVIALFNFYYSIVRNEVFSKRFGEMALISLSVAFLSFIIGFLLKEFTGIEA